MRLAVAVKRDAVGRSLGILLGAADLAVFAEFVVAHQGGEEDAVGAVAPAVEGDEAPPEVPECLRVGRVNFGVNAFLEQNACVEVGVFALFGDELLECFVVVVDERVLQRADIAIEDGFLVDGAVGIVVGAVAAEEAQLAVGPPACATHPVTEDVVVARNPPADFVPVGDDVTDFRGEFRCGALVGVEEEDPVRIGDVQGDVALL